MSSTTQRPRLQASSRIGRMSTGMPNSGVTTMARVRGVISRAIVRAVTLMVRGSTSANTGTPPS